MENLSVLNIKGENVGKISLNELVWGIEPNDAVLYDAIKELNMSIRSREINYDRVSTVFNTINYMLDLVGMYKYDKRLTEEEKQLYNEWQNAKSIKDFAKADEIRNELIAKGIL
mgnify:CR=1 FL=1